MHRIPHQRRTHGQLAAQLAMLLLLSVGGAAAPASPPEPLPELRKQVLRLWDQSKWIEATPVAERFATETIKRHGENHTNSADALHWWAFMVQQSGDDDRAELLFRRALAIDEKLFGKDTVETTRRWHMIAGIYRDRGDYRTAAPLLHKILAIRERDLGTNHAETAQVVRSLGQLYLHAGDFARAETTLWRALRIYENAGKYSQKNIPGTLSTLGWLYLDVGDKEKAEEMWQRAFEIRKKLHGMEHESTAHSLRELAVIHRVRGEFEKSNTLLQESLAIREKLLGTNHISLAEILNALADRLIFSGELAKAEDSARRAQAVVEMNRGSEDPELAGALMTLSRIQEKLGAGIEARKLCQRAYDLRRKAFGISHRYTLGSLSRLAFLDATLGQPERAIAVADILQDGEETFWASVLSFTSERQRLASLHSSDFRERYDLWASLGAVGPLSRAVLRTKGLVLDSLVEDRLLADASDDPRIAEIVGEGARLRRQIDRMSPLAATKSNSTNAAALLELTGKLEALEGSLARQIAGLGHARRALSVTAEQVRAALPEGTALLEFVRYERQRHAGHGRRHDSYGALIFERHREPQWVDLGPAEAIEKSIKLYQHAVRAPAADEALADALRELYEHLWTPLAAHLPANARRIIISPDSELNFVSFAALLTPAQQFLGEDFLFSYVASGRDLLVQAETRPATPQLFIWANPDFGAPPQSLAGRDTIPAIHRGGLRGLDFRALPGSEKEGKALRAAARNLGFEGAILYLGTNATEAQLRQLQSPRALHLATHGFVLPQMEALPDVEGTEFASANRIAMAKPNAMLRSGLALAGAQHSLRARARGEEVPSHNDGIVTADEISGLDLRGTSLVVLSACDTGTGEALAGEGVLGLRRGFIRAGARNLLMTLWPIDDQSAAGLMADFYAKSSQAGSSSVALSQVQREWLRKLRVEKGIAEACRMAGPFILSFQGRPE